MNFSTQRQGEVFVFLAVLLWSIFPILTQLSYSQVSPFTSLTVSSLVSGLFFAGVMTLKRRWSEIINFQAVKYALLATFFVGIIYYLLYFLSLKYSTVGNVSILALSETFFSFLLFHVWHKEYFPRVHIIGAGLILLGAVIVLVPSLSFFRLGDLLILFGAAIVPFGNLFVQKARKLISTETIMFIRGMTSSLVIFILSWLLSVASPSTQITSSMPFLITNGILIGLSTMLWVEGIHRLPVTKANALSSLGPLITLLIVWLVYKTAPSLWQLLAFVPMFFGVMLISKKITPAKA